MKELKDNWEGKKNKNNCHCKANIFLSYLLPNIYARSLLYKFLLLSLVFVSPFFCLSPNFIKECSTPTVPTSKYSIYCVGWSVAYNFNVLKLFCHRSLLSHTLVVSHFFVVHPFLSKPATPVAFAVQLSPGFPITWPSSSQQFFAGSSLAAFSWSLVSQSCLRARKSTLRTCGK